MKLALRAQTAKREWIIIERLTGNTLLENIASGVTEGISGIGGLFGIQPSSGGNPDEAEYLQQKKKKKTSKAQRYQKIKSKATPPQAGQKHKQYILFTKFKV